MGNKGISFFLDKETWPHIISTHACFNFKSFNPKGKKIQSHQRLPLLCLYFFLYYFLFFCCLTFCLDRPFGFSV